MILLADKHNDQKLQGEVKRLSGLRQFPASSAAKTELKKALATAQNLNHATRSVDRLLETATFCPTPAEIRQAVESTPVNVASVHCDVCGGAGWYHNPMENTGHGCMVICRCSAGDGRRAYLQSAGGRVMGARG